MKWKHWKKWALVGGIILIGCSARFLSISQIEKNSVITISDSDVFQQWEIRAAIQQTAADFTIWHPLSPQIHATAQTFSYEESLCQTEWKCSNYGCKRENFIVISCTFLTDETASRTVFDMQGNTVYSQTWIFTRKAKFLPWVLQSQGEG